MAGNPSGVTSRCTSPVVPRGPSPPVGTLAQKAGGAATDTIAHVTISPSPQEPCHTVISHLHGNTSLIKKI